jgi:hypothetical protein
MDLADDGGGRRALDRHVKLGNVYLWAQIRQAGDVLEHALWVGRRGRLDLRLQAHAVHGYVAVDEAPLAQAHDGSWASGAGTQVPLQGTGVVATVGVAVGTSVGATEGATVGAGGDTSVARCGDPHATNRGRSPSTDSVRLLVMGCGSLHSE